VSRVARKGEHHGRSSKPGDQGSTISPWLEFQEAGIWFARSVLRHCVSASPPLVARTGDQLQLRGSDPGLAVLCSSRRGPTVAIHRHRIHRRGRG